MAGTSTKTKVIGLRVPIALAEQWEAAAKKAGVKVGALVIDLAQRGRRLSAKAIAPVPEAPIDLPMKDVEISVQAKEIERLGKVVVSQQMIISKIPPDDILADLRAQLGQREIKISDLEIALAKSRRPPDPRSSALRTDPANRAIDPKVHHVSGPVLSDVVPRNLSGAATGYQPKKGWKA